jgi:hypothetical protein
MSSSDSDARSPYPLSDTPLQLPSGTTVRLRNRVVFRGRHTTRLTIVIETPTAADAIAQLQEESREVAEVFRQFATTEQIAHLTVMVCRTQTCLEMREPSHEMFHFVRDGEAPWQPDLAATS